MVASLAVAALATLAAALASDWHALAGLARVDGPCAVRPAGGGDGLSRRRDRTPPRSASRWGSISRAARSGGMFGRLVVAFVADHWNWRVAMPTIARREPRGRACSSRSRCRASARSRARRRICAASLARIARALFRSGAAAAVRRGLPRDGVVRLHLQLHRLPPRRAAVLVLDQTTIGFVFAALSRRRGEFDRDGRTCRARSGRRRVLWIARADRARRRRRDVARQSFRRRSSASR